MRRIADVRWGTGASLLVSDGSTRLVSSVVRAIELGQKQLCGAISFLGSPSWLNHNSHHWIYCLMVQRYYYIYFNCSLLFFDFWRLSSMGSPKMIFLITLSPKTHGAILSLNKLVFSSNTKKSKEWNWNPWLAFLMLAGAVCTTMPLTVEFSAQSLVVLQTWVSTLEGWPLSCKHVTMMG